MARMKANYPDWVMKHKTKGRYINFVPPDKYYLYEAHSVRDKETGKIIRICDGYLGRITETDGLILSKKKRPPEDHSVHTLEYGFSYVIRRTTDRIRSALCSSYHKNGTIIYALSILNYMYGFYDESLFRQSYLSVIFPDAEYPSSLSASFTAAVERGTRMISEIMNDHFHDSLSNVRAYSSSVAVIQTDNSYSLPDIPDHTKALLQKYRIRLGEDIHAKNR